MALSACSLFISLILLSNLTACFLSYYLFVCLLIPLAAAYFKGPGQRARYLRSFGFSFPRRRDLAPGLVSGLAMTLVMVFAFILLKPVFLNDNNILSSIKSWGVPSKHIVFIFLVMLFFNGAVEEFFWRGYIRSRFAKAGNHVLAVGLPAVFFCGQHIFVIGSLFKDPFAITLCMTGIGSAGIIWGMMRERGIGLWACILSHMIVTTGYLGIFYLFILT